MCQIHPKVPSDEQTPSSDIDNEHNHLHSSEPDAASVVLNAISTPPPGFHTYPYSLVAVPVAIRHAAQGQG